MDYKDGGPKRIFTVGFNPYTFRLDIGGTLTIAVSFNADPETAMSLWDAAHEFGLRYPEFPGCGNYDFTHPKQKALLNPFNDRAITFQFNVGYKMVPLGPTSPNEPWNMCDGEVQDHSPTLIVIGYRDTLVQGSNFTNCIISVSVDKGSTPLPGDPLHLAPGNT